MRHSPLALALVAPFFLNACEPQPEGKPVMRTEIGKGAEEAAAIAAEKEAQAKAEKAKQSVCASVTFEDVPLTHCIADPSRHLITTALASPDGTIFRSLRAFAGQAETGTIVFAMNAGMYDGDGKPIGYYVEEKERLAELNRNEGPGNFHLKPNGVFFGTDGKWQVKTSSDFYSTVGTRPQFGTQSGPMLVTGGKLHPQFQDDGPSKAIRNGVGVDKAGKAHFVISEAPVSFGKFARYFRDELKTPDALFLDGNVSGLWDPARERIDGGPPIGPLLVVKNRKVAR